MTALAERFEAFSLRERGLIALGIIVVMYLVWDTLMLGPEEVKQKQIVSEMHSINTQTEALTGQINEMTAALQGGEAENINARMNELTVMLDKLEQQQKDLTIEFIRPMQMAGVLRDMLQAENGLVLTKLESLGAEPLFPESDENKTENEKSQKRKNASGIYKHGLQVVFEGDYFKTLKYLRALENMPWRLYWDNVEYQVSEYPKASVSITVHTLSLHEGWIGV